LCISLTAPTVVIHHFKIANLTRWFHGKMKKKAGKKPKQAVPVMTNAEHPDHAKLKAAVAEIIRISSLKCDTEVHLNFTGNRRPSGHLVDEASIDVAAYGSHEGKGFLIAFECKRGPISEVNKKISAWEANIGKMKEGKTEILHSGDSAIKKADFDSFEDIFICYVFGKNVERQTFNNTASALRARDFFAWDNGAVIYYKKNAATIGAALKYELLKEFGISLESNGSYKEDAISIKQGGIDMFLFGAKPSVLLKIGYVSRRASGRPEAYQRILNRDRILKISEFLTSKNPLLPNAIIIAFDDEPNIQAEIKYSAGKLTFPRTYCSAWIIDGQHRVFGFLNTKLMKESEQSSEHLFKLPVVAFKKLQPLLQNRAFVNINYNQKKIDPALLCDLASTLPDLQNELTWPSLLVAELNNDEPLKDRIKISELDQGRPISITSFASYALLEGLLGFDKKSRTYHGALYNLAPFKLKAKLTNAENRKALKEQTDILVRYFKAVKANTSKPDAEKDPWRNTKKYSLLKPTSVNALLLVLSRIMDRYPRLEKDIHKNLQIYLKPLRKMTFTRTFVTKQGGGWKGFRNLANIILRKLNIEHTDSLTLYGKKEKK
jgi:DGQHR domain-containing protein